MEGREAIKGLASALITYELWGSGSMPIHRLPLPDAGT